MRVYSACTAAGLKPEGTERTSAGERINYCVSLVPPRTLVRCPPLVCRASSSAEDRVCIAVVDEVVDVGDTQVHTALVIPSEEINRFII